MVASILLFPLGVLSPTMHYNNVHHGILDYPFSHLACNVNTSKLLIPQRRIMGEEGGLCKGEWWQISVTSAGFTVWMWWLVATSFAPLFVNVLVCWGQEQRAMDGPKCLFFFLLVLFPVRIKAIIIRDNEKKRSDKGAWTGHSFVDKNSHSHFSATLFFF